MTDELKACPFCGGGEAQLFWGSEEDACRFGCIKGCTRTMWWDNKDQAIKAWNTRPIEDNLRTQNAELVKALEEIREIYAGMDGFCPLTAPEAYQDKILKEIWELARKALSKG